MKILDSVAVVLYCNEKILLQKRENKVGIKFPGKWCMFGGGIEEGESPEEAAKREIEEELEYSLKKINKIYENDYIYKSYGVKGKFYVFIEKINEKEKKELVLHEGENMGWFTLNEAKKLDWGDLWHEMDVSQIFDIIKEII